MENKKKYAVTVRENEKNGGTLESQKSLDGLALITIKRNPKKEDEVTIRTEGMTTTELASAILRLANQNPDLKNLIKADFLEMSADFIKDAAHDMRRSITDRAVEEFKAEQVGGNIQ
ncbi:hypothetical protein [Staphylococcus aureus]|uniref:hypothetical protein n=1 Tax=Staphylococcus aureus TaxID=1280 RepID=UPI0020BF581E|nr:hypothetical protein [Staphylococcus aureus]